MGKVRGKEGQGNANLICNIPEVGSHFRDIGELTVPFLFHIVLLPLGKQH